MWCGWCLGTSTKFCPHLRFVGVFFLLNRAVKFKRLLIFVVSWICGPFASMDWRILFLGAYVENLCCVHLDNCPILVWCGGCSLSSRKRPFRFQVT